MDPHKRRRSASTSHTTPAPDRTAQRSYQRPNRLQYQTAGAVGVPTKRTRPTAASGTETLALAAAGSCPAMTPRVATARLTRGRRCTGARAARVDRRRRSSRRDRVGVWPARRAPAGVRPIIDSSTRCLLHGEDGVTSHRGDTATTPVRAPQPATAPDRTAGTPQKGEKAAAPQPTETAANSRCPLPAMKRHRVAARRTSRGSSEHEQSSDRGPIRAPVSSGRELMTRPGAAAASRSRS